MKNSYKGVAKKASNSALWSIAGGGIQTIIRLCASAVLARILLPQDFGLFGMALLGRQFVLQVGNVGMGTGLISKSNINEEDICTCFWSMLFVRVTLFFICLIVAPLFNVFFNEGGVASIFRVVSITFLFAAIGSVPRQLMQKQLKFKKLIIINTIGIFFDSSIAIILVLFYEASYWSLVLAMLTSAFLVEFLIVFSEKWYPKLIFSRKSFRYLIHFGINVQLFSMLKYFQQNLDYLVVGRLLGTASLGLYEFAFRIPYMIRERLAKPIFDVLFPTLSGIQEHPILLIEWYLKTIRMISLFVFPVLIGIAMLAKPLVLFLWGEVWLPIVVPLKILCAYAMVESIMSPNILFNIKKRPEMAVKQVITQLLFLVPLLIFLGNVYTLVGVAFAMLISSLPSFFFTFTAFKMFDAPFINFFKSIKETIVLNIVMGVTVHYYSFYYLKYYEDQILLNLVTSSILGAFVYLITAYLFYNHLYSEVKSVVQRLGI